MEMREFTALLGTQLKQIVHEYVPEQTVAIEAGFAPGSDDVSFSFFISVRPKKAEARRG